MDSTEKRVRDLEKKVAHLEAESKLKAETLRLLHRLIKENQANIKEYLLKTLFPEKKDKP
jgi:hypothetical protein